jgi:carboxypeptidase Taq
MKHSEQEYANLKEISHHAYILSGIHQLLDWDQETYMPIGAAPIRAVQLKTLAGIIHAEKTSKKLSQALDKLIDLSTGKVRASELSPRQQAALHAWRRDYLQEKSLPKSFVEEFAKLCSHSMTIWREAKKKNDFALFAPYLKKIIEMSRKKADYLGYDEHPYDALLDQYEPGISVSKLDLLFSKLKPFLVNLVKKIGSGVSIDDTCLYGSFSHLKQLKFAKTLLHAMGYDEQHGRLDLSAHPFSSSSHPTDTRITTRFHPRSLMSCISVVLHEAGHALYERGLPVEEFGTPLGSAISLGMHESQSRWWETLIGQSRPFWSWGLPLLKKQFKGKFDKVSLEQFYRALNKVQPSLIRVDADEVTYNLHIILRFEIERMLIEGSLSYKEVPEVWKAKMQQLLGICPQTDAEGCLQDVHWSMGGFGYFPSYTLGNLYAAQFFTQFAQDHPDWQERVSSGQLLFIKDWLHQHIHRYGRQYQSAELLKKITGRQFSPQPFMNYLTDKYGAI